MRELELLSPAADKATAIEAILHGADAVYMGGPSHGARKNASNSIEDIKEVVDFAHQFRGRVYVTVNTLVYENEIKEVERLVRELYEIGVDALIVQDMSLLRMSLPPIELHASTQCDIQTPEKALFLEKVGFSQLVLARELTLDEIKDICSKITVPVECFVHGALCVSYSGRCGASQAVCSRSANRGECSQVCRLPFTLTNADGDVILKDRHLLSLRDLNASAKVPDLIEAGVSSFKIEGRLKELGYVKNVTSAYRKIIDNYISSNPERFKRSSCGVSEISFESSLEKSFNRGFTDYFLSQRKPGKMASLRTPKSMGEKIEKISDIHNGDGISFFNSKGEYEGVRVNRVENGRIIGAKRFMLPPGAEIRRTFDIEWQKKMDKPSAVRKIRLNVSIDSSGVTASDERGVAVRVPLTATPETARKPQDLRGIFDKFGNSIYRLVDFENNLPENSYLPPSAVSLLRKELMRALEIANKSTYSYKYRRKEDVGALYPSDSLTTRDNVSNSVAESFYKDHGIKSIAKALETQKRVERGEEVMTTRYCLRRELGCCKLEKGGNLKSYNLKEPLRITSGKNSFRIEFDCAKCEMKVIKD